MCFLISDFPRKKTKKITKTLNTIKKIVKKNKKKPVKQRAEKVLAIGAEAVLTLHKKKGITHVLKQRTRKKYRIAEIDSRLRSSRTRREAKVLDKLKDLGFTPKVLFSDDLESIKIEYLPGKKLADCLEQTDCVAIGKEIGKKIRQIHDAGIIHGDLTTSNLLLVSGTVYFIDFGLSFFSQKIEDKAVDLHVLEEALESKHHTVSRKVFAAVKEAYGNKEVLQRLLEVELRGRNKKGS